LHVNLELFGIKRQTTTKKTNLKVSESTTTRRFIQPTTKKPNFFCPFGQFAHVPGSSLFIYQLISLLKALVYILSLNKIVENIITVLVML
jgi:hypothetical protein